MQCLWFLVFSLPLASQQLDSAWSSVPPNALSASYLPAGVQVLAHFMQQLTRGRSGPDSAGNPQVVETVVIEIVESGRMLYTPKTSSKATEGKMRSLLALLIKEAKTQDYAKYQGYAAEVISDLEQSSTLTATEQLLYVLQKINLAEIKSFDLRSQLNQFILDLNNRGSELRTDLQYLQPLRYIS